MVLIDSKEYFQQTPMTPENADYNAALIYYINTQVEIEELQKQLKKYAKTIKRLSKVV